MDKGCAQGPGRRAAAASRGVVVATAVPALALLGSLSWQPRPLLLWNASESSPRGLYLVTAKTDLQIGDIAIAWPPAEVRSLASERNYLPRSVPLVKRVGAVASDRVCAFGSLLLVNGRVAAVRRSTDPSGRGLPWWSGCQCLGEGEALLLSAGSSDAFDGRYFGPSKPHEIIGEGMLLWRR